MSDLRKAAQAVIQAWDDPAGTTGVCRALDALRAALAEPTVPSDCPPYSHQPTPQPVAWMKTDGAITTDAYQAACWRDSHTVTPLYAAPPQRHVKAPCRYPDCVDNAPDGKCTRWLLAECEKSEDYQR